MATLEHFVEIDERFCQCPICLQQYKEPKQLPCLHRYCRNCLEQLMEKNGDVGYITCPECREEFEIPEESVDGFKTDFYVQNVIDYIQFLKSLEDEQMRECCDCARKIKVTAYCFKCNDFLCNECHNSHVTKKILKDHKEHTLSLEDIKSTNMTLKKLVALKEAPRCQHHPENLSQICCKTCHNLPICVPCTYGSHENHKIKDVHILATDEKEKLNGQLGVLYQYKERMYKLTETVTKVKRDLICTVKEKKEFCQTRYKRNVNKIEKEMQNVEESTRIQEIEIRDKKEKNLTEKQRQMEKELEEIRRKYGKMCDVLRKESEEQLRNLNKKHDVQIKEKKEKLRGAEIELNSLMTSIDKRQKELEKKLEEISLHIDSTVKRFENLTATARSILETGNDWTTVQSIPDIRAASEPLSAEMKREFPELEIMSQIKIGVEISQNAVSTIDVEMFGIDEICYIEGITHSDDGKVIIAVRVSSGHSHIMVVNTDGKVLHHKELKNFHTTPHYPNKLHHRVYSYLTQFKLATVSGINEIGVFNVHDGSFIKKDIKDIISTSLGEISWTVATDLVNSHIFVGSLGGRHVHIFNEQLTYLHTMTLPYTIIGPYNMTVSNRSLLVCDLNRENVYAVSIEGFDGNILHEFKKPVMGGYWKPICMCTDKNMFVYMLWKSKLKGNRCLLVQYTPDGQEILTERQLDNRPSHLTVVETGQAEKLVVAFGKPGKLYLYDLGRLRLW